MNGVNACGASIKVAGSMQLWKGLSLNEFKFNNIL